MDVEFPPVELADPETGLLCVGGDLSVSTLLAAYRSGVFPWPLGEGDELYWFAPEQRGVLLFRDLHVSRSLKRFQERSPFLLKSNQDFQKIISRCATVRTDEGERTWITPRLQQAYAKLFEAGNVLCVGAYRNDRLVGGVYGVLINKFFAGESMFFEEPNASKLALLSLIADLQSRGISWMDCQQLTPLLSQFGGKLLPRSEFMRMLSLALR